MQTTLFFLLLCLTTALSYSQGLDTKSDSTNPMTLRNSETNPLQRWNFHVQNTDIVQGDAPFPAMYSGPNSLNKDGEVRETGSSASTRKVDT